jgi:signal recognition particle receptor subunit beta
MPIIDKARGVLVIRLVYDGPPMSGKTTSVRALARGLGVNVETPEESDGRTLYFDWMDYIGGVFEGRQIRCQVVSVPGQAEHARRRAKLLASADAVILVADTRASKLPAALAVLEDLLPRCRSQDPPVGVVLQANKRDAPDSVPRAQMQAELSAIAPTAPIAIVETVATAGDGIRAAFVFGIRLALDRVRALADSGRLPIGEPEVDRAAELLARLQAGDRDAALTPTVMPGALPSPHTETEDDSLTPTLVPVAPPSASPENETETPRPLSEPNALDGKIAFLSGTRRSRPSSVSMTEVPFVPDASLPGGFIWPPVDGRVLLHEVAQLGITPVRTARGDWWASAQGCLFHSSASAIYANADQGRIALVDWARMHATQLKKLSAGRTVILAPAGDGQYRLWQLIRAEQALRERLAASLCHSDPERVARELLECASHLLQARACLQTPELGLPCTLWTVSGDLQTRPRFVGLMPDAGMSIAEEPQGAALIAREFTPLLAELREHSAAYSRIVEDFSRRSDHAKDPSAADFLSRVA